MVTRTRNSKRLELKPALDTTEATENSTSPNQAVLATAQRFYRIAATNLLYFFWLFWTIGQIKQRRIGNLSLIILALIPTDVNPLGFFARSSEERRGITRLVDGDDVHGPTTAFQDHALATDTPPPMLSRSCGARHPTTRTLVLQAIEEPARTSRTSTELLDVNEGFKLSPMKWGSEDKKTGD